MICPDCEGQKQHFAHVNRGENGQGGYEWINCFRCKGAGEVPDEQAEWILRGKLMRCERVASGASLRDEAARLGISVVHLSEMERGMRSPLTQPVNEGPSKGLSGHEKL